MPRDSDRETLGDPVRLPVQEGPATGRYALLQPLNSSGFPNSQHHILIARSIPGSFRPVFAVHLPFDEQALILVDSPHLPERVLVYQAFTLAWSTDGGGTVHQASEEDMKRLGVGRWGPRHIKWAGIVGDQVYLELGAESHFVDLRPPSGPGDQRGSPSQARELYRFSPDKGSLEPVAASRLPDETGPRATAALLQTDGHRLHARSKGSEPFAEVPVADLLAALDPSSFGPFGRAGSWFVS